MGMRQIAYRSFLMMYGCPYPPSFFPHGRAVIRASTAGILGIKHWRVLNGEWLYLAARP